MTNHCSRIPGYSPVSAFRSASALFNACRLIIDVKNNRLRGLHLLLSALFATVILLAPKSASAATSTWANSVATNGTLVGTGTSGYYYDAATLAVGDAIYVTTSSNGLTQNRVYYVTAISGTAYGLSISAGGSVAALANIAGNTIPTLKGVYTWDAAGATNTQAGASWNNGIPNGVDAVANFASNSNGGAIVAIQNAETVGTINFSASSNDFNLISSNNGTTTTLSALTFATSAGTPTINDTSTSKIIRLGLSDASWSQGQLKISGTQGLLLQASSASTAIRIETVDWSGFTDGNGGRGTLILQSGTAGVYVANAMGTGTGAISLTVGNASTTGSAGAIFNINTGATQAVNVLNGATNGYIYSAVASEVLTVGTAGGTGGDFAGVIGVNPYLSGTAGNNNTTNISLVKSGTGVQTISGQIVGSSTATNTVTVNGGTLILSGSNSYGGATSVTGGTLSLQGANAVTLNTVTLSSSGSLTETAANGLGGSASLSIAGGTATLSQANNYSGTTSLSSGALYVNNAGALGSGVLTLSGGTIDATNGAITGQSNNPAITLGSFTFGGSNNLNLGTGAVSITGSTTTITLDGGGSTLTLGGTATNTNSSQTAGITTTVNGTGNTLIIGGFTLSTSGTQAVTDTFNGGGNISITGAVTNGTAFANSLTYSGSATLTLGGSNSYTGITTISGGGTLSVSSLANGGAVSNIGASSNAAANLIFNGGTLSYTGASVTIDRGFTYSSGAGGTINVSNAATNLEITGLAAQSSIGGSSLTKTGAGTLTLSGTGDTSSFGLIVNAGEVDLNDSGAAGSGRVITRNGAVINGGGIVKITGTNGDQIQNAQVVTVNNGTFNMNGKSETAGTLTIGDGINNGIISGGSNSTYTSGGGTFEAKSGSVDVKLAGGGAVLNKTTGGTVTLSQANTYTGATNVTGGTLVVSGSISGTASVGLGSSTLEVDGSLNAAATISSTNSALQGTGIVGAVSLTSTSTVAPGLTSSSLVAGATLRAGSVTFSDTGSALSLGLGITTGSDGTQLNSNGTVTLNNTPLQLTLGSALNNVSNVGLAYIILKGGAGATGGGSDVFSYGGVALANTNTFTTQGGFTFEVLYGGVGVGTNDIGTANDVELVLTAVPEPGAWAMLLGGTGMLIAFQRKRLRKA